jgi:HlyD family secretion protein
MTDAATDRRLSPRVAAGVLGLVLLLVLAVAALRRPDAVAASAAKAARADLLVPILSDGTLEPPPGGELRAPDRARVAAIRAHEGERVAQGALLLELENSDLSTRSRDARAASSQLEVERVKVTADLEAEKAEAARLRKIVEGDQRLFAEGAITRETFDADQTALEAARQREGAARARLESLTATRIGLSEESARELSRRAEALAIHAPADGVVYNLPRKVGESVEEGQIVASVSDPDHLRVRARVDQPDLPRVAAGQRIVVTFDGLPDRRWGGKVTLVAPGLREVEGRQVGEVLGEISDPTAQLPPNASVNVQIVVAEKSSALVVPRAAVIRDGDRRYVWALRGGRARRQDVTVGLIGLTEVEIQSGLAEGDSVLISGAVPLTEGLRVAAK